uniref:Uncharacterized protein n=1 Tax=Tetranychus urticae TaxID=32264 RepID=T1KM17_TETUR
MRFYFQFSLVNPNNFLTCILNFITIVEIPSLTLKLDPRTGAKCPSRRPNEVILLFKTYKIGVYNIRKGKENY